MPVPGSPEWIERVQRLMDEESEQPERLFMLSFADDDGLRGVVITREHGPTRAHRKTHALGINPGGEVMIIEVPPWEVIEPIYLDRLLTRSEAERAFGEEGCKKDAN